ncbi:kinesin-II 95 kDa subunit [Pyricularia oryzae]|nr:kinesin-II 95 kDa subunit [Pyricularia oryzae]
MSVRVVARIRPLLEKELEKDIIVRPHGQEGKQPNVVKIPSPKNPSEEFSFTFNSVYDLETSQETLFTSEVAPHVKSLFQGLDVTIFAYGVTGTGKTHTMRGGLRLAERGVIPRLLSAVFRRGKKIMKDSDGETTVDVALSYYEIYNDKVFDLLEPPEKRTPSGLPLREANNKTYVVGLSERQCVDLKDFENLYIEANNNRVTAATKLNAHSSRSHAILRVKVTQTTGDTVKESTASAIDLAGSEDNRRTDNGKERLVESAAINKSLFVLSQCVDAISRGEKRIPYRESKMTRILSLGQNNGITIMILNLSPMRAYHLDTLSSLNVSSRAKRIEVREIENEVVYKQFPRTNSGGPALGRQPLRPLANAHNTAAISKPGSTSAADKPEKEKPTKLFSVYKSPAPAKPPKPAALALTKPTTANMSMPRAKAAPVSPTKRKPENTESNLSIPRPSKLIRPTQIVPRQLLASTVPSFPSMTAEQIEAMVERKVAEVLAARAAAETQAAPAEPPKEISEAVQKRLDELERKIADSNRDDDGPQGLRLILQARQCKEQGDEEGALHAYEEALRFFPGQAKLLRKIQKQKTILGIVDDEEPQARVKPARATSTDSDFHGTDGDVDDDGDSLAEEKTARAPRKKKQPRRALASDAECRSILLLARSSSSTFLTGFGAKKARDLVENLALLAVDGDSAPQISSLAELRAVPGMGGRTVDRAYEGLASETVTA